MAIKIIYPSKDTTIFSSSKAPPDYTAGGFFSGSVYANAGAFQMLKLSKTIDTTLSASSGLRIGQGTADGSGYPINLDRILIKFNFADLSASLKMNTDNPPADGGSIGPEGRYYLKMFNAGSAKQAAKSFTVNTHLVISQSWNEGDGLAIDSFRDPGYANWKNPSSTGSWHTPGLGSGSITTQEASNPDKGADYLNYFSGSLKVTTSSFDVGYEDMEVEITDLMQVVLSGSGRQALPNLGFLVKLGQSEEKNNVDYSEKLFFSKDTSTIYSPQVIVKYNDFRADDRGYMLTDTPNRLYLNYSKRGNLVDIKGITNGPVSSRNMSSFLTCSIFSGNLSGTLPTGSSLATLVGAANYHQGANLTCSRFVQGVYRTPLFEMSKSYLSGSGSGKFFDVWYNTANTTANYMITRSFVLYEDDYYNSRVSLSPQEFTTAIPGLQKEYSQNDTSVRLDVTVRKRGTSLDDPDRNKIFIVHTGSYKVADINNKETIIDYDDTYSRLSYDENGNYFNLDMSSFDRKRTYEVKFRYKINNRVVISDSEHRFRIS